MTLGAESDEISELNTSELLRPNYPAFLPCAVFCHAPVQNHLLVYFSKLVPGAERLSVYFKQSLWCFDTYCLAMTPRAFVPDSEQSRFSRVMKRREFLALCCLTAGSMLIPKLIARLIRDTCVLVGQPLVLPRHAQGRFDHLRCLRLR